MVMEQMYDMRVYVENNLKEISTEILDWHKTGILHDGKFRFACSILSDIDSANRSRIVESTVNTLCLKLVAGINYVDRIL